MQCEDLHERLDCKCSSKGAIDIHEEGIDNEIRKGQLTESSTESVVESVVESVNESR